jgi:hypothetical protein
MFFLLSVSLTGYSQLNPIRNLNWQHWYDYPNNFYRLKWSPPETSLTDTLVGYNIYRDNMLYRFYSDTIAQHIFPQDTTFGGEGFVSTFGGPFYIHVTAVYGFNHLESIYDHTELCYGAAIGLSEIQKEIIRISPNPMIAQTTLFVDKIMQSATVTVYNVFGQQVKQINNVYGHMVTLFRDDLPSGFYSVTLTQGQRIIATEKLVIMD